MNKRYEQLIRKIENKHGLPPKDMTGWCQSQYAEYCYSIDTAGNRMLDELKNGYNNNEEYSIQKLHFNLSP